MSTASNSASQPTFDSAPSSPPISARKLRANRRNAQHSTGPRTPEGKARSAQNATSHGYFCAHAVLPGESADAFEQLRESFIDDHNPQTLSELLIVDRIVIAAWKLNRLQQSEHDLHQSKIDELVDLAKVMVEIPHKQMNQFSYRAQGICREVLEQAEHGMTPAQSTAATLVDRRSDRSLDRLALLEQRLQNTIFRCHRELRLLRKDRAQVAALPRSPFSKREMESLPHCYEEWRARIPSTASFQPPTFDQLQEMRASAAVAECHDRIENTQNEPTDSGSSATSACDEACNDGRPRNAPAAPSPTVIAAPDDDAFETSDPSS